MGSRSLGTESHKNLLKRAKDRLHSDAAIAARLGVKTTEIPVWRNRGIPAKYRRSVEDLVAELEGGGDPQDLDFQARMDQHLTEMKDILREISASLKGQRAAPD